MRCSSLNFSATASSWRLHTSLTRLRWPPRRHVLVLGRSSNCPCRSQPSRVILASPGVYDMNLFAATCETILNERKQYSVLFVVTAKERTNMTGFVRRGRQKEWAGSAYCSPFRGPGTIKYHSVPKPSNHSFWFHRPVPQLKGTGLRKHVLSAVSEMWQTPTVFAGWVGFRA